MDHLESDLQQTLEEKDFRIEALMRENKCKDDEIQALQQQVEELRNHSPLDEDDHSVPYSYFSRTTNQPNPTPQFTTPTQQPSSSNISLGSRMSRTSRTSRYAHKIITPLSEVGSLLDQPFSHSHPTSTASTDINTSSQSSLDNPLHCAIRSLDEDALSMAVSNASNQDMNRGDDTGKTPLHLAVLTSNLHSIQLLLDNHSVANTQDQDGNTPLHCAKDYQVIQLLLQQGKANPNIPNGAGICVLHLAVQRRDSKSVRLLLDHKAHVNVADDTRWRTPLHFIAQPEHPSNPSHNHHDMDNLMSPTGTIAKMLCEAQTPSVPDFNYQDRDGNTPLHFAAMLDTKDAGDILSLFLKHGANPNITNLREQTPLHLFCHNTLLRNFDFYHDMLHLLLHHGADPTLASSSGCTSLHLCLYHQDIDSALQLMAKGAQLHLPWNKPPTWVSFWEDNHGSSSSSVICLDMLQDENDIRQIISAVSCEQKWARAHPTCMQCKTKFGRFSRQHHCRHCGCVVCGKCSPHTLDDSYFPTYCQTIDSGRVCKICEEVLVGRKQSQSLEGKNVYAIHGCSEDVSFLDTNENSFLNESMTKATSIPNDF